MNPDPSSKEFFERLYSHDADPWNFAASAYEQGRYQAICEALESRRYRRAFEPGCSVGVLTERLAAFCEKVEAIEISATAVGLARQRCESLSNVTITSAALADYKPQGSFDLIVFSEVGYYFSVSDLRCVVQGLMEHLDAGGTFLAAHWLGWSEDHKIGGDEVHEVLANVGGLALEHSERREEYRLDRWSRL